MAYFRFLVIMICTILLLLTLQTMTWSQRMELLSRQYRGTQVTTH